MEKQSSQMISFLLLMFTVHQSLELCSSLHEDNSISESSLPAVKEHYVSLSKWEENIYAHTCSKSAADCFRDGRAVALRNAYKFSMWQSRRVLAQSSQRPSSISPSPLEAIHRGESAAPSPAANTDSRLPFPFPAPDSPPLSPFPAPDSPPPSPSPAPDKAPPSPSPSHSPSPIPSPTPDRPIASPPIGHKKRTIWLLYVVIGAPVTFIIILFSIFLMFCRANKVVTVMPWKTGLNMQMQKAAITGVPLLNRSELEIACEGFSNIIGSLSSFELYKGTLSNGAEIAVTSTTITSPNEWSDHYEEKFRTKISLLSKVNHKNFMNLIGYCEQAEPFTRMMVFEYAPNGTLFEHLHVKEAEQLDWAARLRIMMGIAYFLSYLEKLNHLFNLQNLNSSSIYLTEDYAAKLSDMEFRIDDKLDEQTEIIVESSNQETIPYKFAIILLELISGRRPISEDDGLLVIWASSYLSGKRPLEDIVDPTIKPVNEIDVTALADVIRSCITMNLNERPTMSEVCEQMILITSISPEEASPRLSPLWWAELQIISS